MSLCPNISDRIVSCHKRKESLENARILQKKRLNYLKEGGTLARSCCRSPTCRPYPTPSSPTSSELMRKPGMHCVDTILMNKFLFVCLSKLSLFDVERGYWSRDTLPRAGSNCHSFGELHLRGAPENLPPNHRADQGAVGGWGGAVQSSRLHENGRISSPLC